MKATLIIVALWSALAAIAGLAAASPGLTERLGAEVPAELRVTDHAGRATTLGELRGKRATVLVPAYFSCPQLCGLNLHAIDAAATELPDLAWGDEVVLLALSFDPADDAAAAQARRRNLMGADGGPPWTFAVIDAADRDAYLAAVGWQVERDPGSGEFAHPAGGVVLTRDGHIASYLPGLGQRSDDLRLALVEAGEGAIGSPLDRLLLLCYHYDPAQRRYGLFVGNFFRFGAVLVVVGGVLSVALLVRRVRRRGLAGPDGEPPHG